MKIAVPYENGNIFHHFSRTQQFKIYTIESPRPMKTEITDTDINSHPSLASFLNSLRVSTVICGSIDADTKEALEFMHIEVTDGIHGDADSAVVAYIAGTLDFDPSLHCSHEDQHSGFHHSITGHGHEHSPD
ncbi:MAG: dinitrogenase iron-molybdenum cofactor biosynthesis protein [Oscillospiraceae bacterium]|nr:dinitrogenase iron-molybdenum cofactor biosynthesis protein [Oscillospiraceae bacterium]